MVYSYRYTTESTLRPEIEWHFFKLRAIPCNNDFQQVVAPRLEVCTCDSDGTLQPCQVLSGTDGLGNSIQWGSTSQPHSRFTFCSEGEVILTRPYAIKEAPAPYYCAATHLTSCTEEMEQWAALFDTPMSLMHATHQLLTYTPCHTTNATTAAEVWNDRKGVCQDYAHLMIALCRAKGWYARYVNGFIEGEGATHAWVEVSDGETWLGYDPTLDAPIEWGYVKIAHGRDANDCPTNRGRFYGWTQEYMTATVKLTI